MNYVLYSQKVDFISYGRACKEALIPESISDCNTALSFWLGADADDQS